MKKVLIFTFSGIFFLAVIIKIISPVSDLDNDIYGIASDVGSDDRKKDESIEKKIIYSDSFVVIHYLGFVVLYDCHKLQPVMADYILTAEQVRATENTPNVPHHFMQDTQLAIPQATDDDYKGVNKKYGLSKGHMARHQDMKWSLQAVQESDYYINICPQNEKLNTKLWKRIENMVRRAALQYDSVHVICGPIFTDNANGYIGPNRIPVPDYFFKALLVMDDAGYHAIAFLCPNNDTTLKMKDAACTVDKVEALSKIDIYSYLPDEIESAIEGAYNVKRWPVASSEKHNK